MSDGGIFFQDSTRVDPTQTFARSPATEPPRRNSRVLAIVMAGGNGSRLGPLTRWQSKPALPFGAEYRNIDFTLSNCINSGLRRIALLTQYKSHSLIQHVNQGWNFLDREIGEFCELWPAQQRMGNRWYAGTADAVYQNVDLIEEIRPELVLVLAGDHIYKMDYRYMIAAHVQHGAAATIACTEVPVADAGNYGILSIDSERRVQTFAEKPKQPAGLPHRPDRALASMGIYVFDRATLIRHLMADARNADSRHDFGHDVLPSIIAEQSARAYVFVDPRTGQPGYWRDVGTLDSYWEANMDLLSERGEIDLHDPDWPIRTHRLQCPPSKYTLSCDISESIVAAGCHVAGTVRRSVLFTNTYVGPGTSIEDSLVLPGARIGRDCVVRRAVIDSGFELADCSIVGEGLPSSRNHHVSEMGVTLVSSASPDATHALRQRTAA
jgi:glucose-1-phosphate adenylyltransferase